MSKGAVYIQFATKLCDFLESRGMNPMEFLHDLKFHLRADAPGKSTLYMALRGQRLLPPHVIWFMKERYGFDMKWRHALPLKDRKGARLKDNQLVLEGWGK